MVAIGAAVAGAIGLVGTTALVAGAAIDIGLAVGASYLSSALTGKSSASQGLQASVQVGGDQPRGCLYGRHGTAGYLAYVNTAVDSNLLLQMVYIIGDGPHDGLDSVWVYGIKRTLTIMAEMDHAILYSVDGFNGLLTVNFHRGYSDQPAPAALRIHANPASRWTTTDRLAGICYVEIFAGYQEELFDGGIPDFFFEVRGRRCYDWRLDSANGGSGPHRWDDEATWAFSDNPMVHLYDYQRGVWRGGERVVGMGIAPVDIDLDAYTAAANACDELVAESDGSSAPRYRCGTTVADNEEHATVIQRILNSCGGALYERVGIYSPHAGVAQVVTYPTITDGDLVTGYEVRLAAKRPRADLVNGLFGSYSEPSERYELIAYTARTDASAEAADGEIIRAQVDFPSVHHPLQAQRLAKLQLDLARLQGTATITLGLRAVVLEPGDWIRWDSARYGDHMWLITGLTQNADQTVTLSLRQISGAAYGWSEDDELDIGFGGSGGDKPPLLTTVPLMGVAPTIIVGDDGTRQPAIRVVWTPIIDGSVDLLTFEYRVASAPAEVMAASTAAASSGSYVIGGLQGATAYEVRGTISGRPARATTWTAWLPVNTGDAQAVPNGSITLEQFTAALRAQFEALDAEALAQMQADVETIQAEMPDVEAAAAAATARAAAAASELRDQVRQLSLAVAEAGAGSYIDLVTTRDGLVSRLEVLRIALGDATASIATLQTVTAAADEALASQITAVSASLATAAASITSLQQAVATLDSATATSIAGLQTSLDGLDASITTAQESISDLQAGKADASTVALLSATVATKAPQSAVDNLSSTVSTQATALSTVQTQVIALQSGKADALTVSGLSATVAGHTSQITGLTEVTADLDANKAAASTVVDLQAQVADVEASVVVGAVATAAPSGASSAWMVTVQTDTAGTIATGGIMIGVFGSGPTRESRLYLQADKTYVMSGSATAALLTIASGQVYLNGDLIASGSITAAKIYTHTITADQISIGGVTTTSLAASAVTEHVSAHVPSMYFAYGGSGSISSVSIIRTSGTEASIYIDFSETYSARLSSDTSTKSVLTVELKRTNGGTTTLLKRLFVRDSPYGSGLSEQNTYSGSTYISNFCTFSFYDDDSVSGTTSYALSCYGSEGVLLFDVNLAVIEYKR